MNKLLILPFLLFSCVAFGQRISQQEYINKYKDIAIKEMLRTGVPASIKLAQGLLESESGNGELCKRSLNHFGIKCKSSWTGDSVTHDDDEVGECFRKYNSVEDSYRDHSEFLRNSPRYAFLFKLSPTDYKGWAYGLKKAGYATNPKYPQILLFQIEKFNLHEFDLIKDSESVEVTASSEPEIMQDEVKIDDAKNLAFDYRVKTKRNGLTAVFAPAGTSTLAIATYYNLALSKLLNINDMEHDGILKSDSWIYLERKNKESTQPSHTVTDGESLFDIAQYHGVQLQKLEEYNGINKSSALSSGTVLKLKPDNDGDTFIYETQQGEGLYAISRKFNVPVQRIKEVNKLSSDNLKVGQKLIISK